MTLEHWIAVAALLSGILGQLVVLLQIDQRLISFERRLMRSEKNIATLTLASVRTETGKPGDLNDGPHLSSAQ